MLDVTTKRKIDSARQILVGKVPDPKAQVEQITTALMYKFMDDMDKESDALGGKAKFFTDNLKNFAWHKVLDKRLSGQERLDLYARGTASFFTTKQLPELFRNIFKNAFLPYRDAETLSLFLKEIDGFTYNHSEDLGDAFEYLLSVLGSQGDAGQFRTPRHIIDFIVAVVDPKKNETILDPACGTAGFLISAYKHIVNANLSSKEGLSPDERKKLMKNFTGYDISPDMVKLSAVNMYLHGFQEPKIYEYDTLSSEEKWGESFDVIMANPPFMSPKGGIRPHKRFSVQASRSEVLFVDYILEHLNLKGRAGIIVPEGIIFKTENAYKQLRKMLVEDGLFAVISLPPGVFNPYSGVKTSILFFDNQLAKKTDEILFLKIENDGFDLGAQRRKIEKNDLPEALKIFEAWKKRQVVPLPCEGEAGGGLALPVKKQKIAESGDYNLTGERYRETEVQKHQKWPMVELGEVLKYEQPTKYIVKSVNYDDSYETPVLTAGKTFILGHTKEKDGVFPAKKLPVIIFDDFTTAIKLVDFPFKVKSSAMKILHAKQEKADIKYLFQVIKTIKFRYEDHKRYWISEYSKIKIPLPPLEVQKEIVERIEVKQNAINAAREVIKNLERERRYFGEEIRRVEGVEWVMLPKICEINSETVNPKIKFKSGDFIYIDIASVENGTGRVSLENQLPLDKAPSRARRVVQNNDVIISTVRPNLKAFALLKNLPARTVASTGFAVLRAKSNINPSYLYLTIGTDSIVEQMTARMGKGSYPSINENDVKQVKIPLPPLEIQNRLVAEAEKEEAIIAANRRLIEMMEEKIAETLSQI